jgi:hypothetical protein
MKETARNAIPTNGIIKIQASPVVNYTSRRAYFSQKIEGIQHQPHVILSVSEESRCPSQEILRFAQNDMWSEG